jgi:hypothetical protein
MRITLVTTIAFAPLLLAACLPVPVATPGTTGMSNPAMGYSGQEISAMSGIPIEMLRNDAQCSRSRAILADPTSTQNERYGATTAARANACPGF